VSRRETDTARMARYEAAVLGALTAAADSGAVCPSNEALVRLIGGGFPARASWVIGRLQAKGLITVERWTNARCITILSSGRSTASILARAMDAGRGKVAVPVAVIRAVEDRGDPPVPENLPLPRVTCTWCGATSMAGCRHLRRAGLIEQVAA